MDIHHWIILGTVSILSGLGVFVPPARTEIKQVDFTPSSQSNQTSEISQINFTLSSQSSQTFVGLIQQAESLATSLINRGFAESPGITEISVSILGERNGQEVPLLFSRVSRSDWQRQPGIQQWTRYFNTSAVLLGFLKPQLQQSTSPTFEDTFTQQSPPPTSEDNSIQQSSPPVPGGTTRQQSPSPTFENNSIQQSPPPVSGGTTTTIQQSPPPTSEDTSKPSRARREERDPGYR